MNEKMITDFSLFARDNHVSSLTLDGYKRAMDSYVNPTIIEERKLNVAQMDVFSRLFMDRILFLGTAIDSDVANILTAQLLFLDTLNPEQDITLYINSPGGEVAAGMSIYDTINLIKAPVATTNMATAASMASVILSSGAKGKRYALPHSRIMIHQPSGGTGRVQAADLYIAAKEMEKCQNMLYDILSENTGMDFKKIAKDCDRDKWFSAEEGITYGLIDKIITKKK